MLKLKHLDRALRQEQTQERAAWKAANVGDTVACEVRNPTPGMLAMTLETPAAVAHANELLADKQSGWRLVQCTCGAMHSADAMAWTCAKHGRIVAD